MSDVITMHPGVDLQRLDEVRDEVAREPERLAEDPQAFFSSLGIHIDGESAASIRRQLEARRQASAQRAVQASAVHIDV